MQATRESERSLKDRISEHIGYVRTQKLDKSTGQHFDKPGHTLSNLTVTIIYSDDIFYRKERETYFNRHFNTYYRGLNLRL